MTQCKKINLRLAREWHPAKNAPLTTMDVTYGSGKKVWWKCQKSHEWEAIIAIRTRGSGCPYCYRNRRINHKVMNFNLEIQKEIQKVLFKKTCNTKMIMS